MKINDLNYLNKFYKKKDKKILSSNFAKFIKKKLITKKSNILEIGTGNGRDAFYFSKYSKNVLAIDQSIIAISNNKLRAKRLSINNLEFKSLPLNKFMKIKNRSVINLIYARFFIHSINQNNENLFLKNLTRFNKLKPLIVLEFRTTKDELMKKGKKLSKFERYTDHYRRFIDTETFEKKIKKMGFIITYKKLGINLSKTKKDNPHLCRIIFKKK